MGRKKIEIIKGYKATNKDMTCRGFKYELGKEYKEDIADLCYSGFHFCENPLDVLNYYDLTNCNIYEVEAKEVSPQTEDDSKRVSKRIKLKTELSLKKFINLSFEYLKEQATIKNTDDGSIISNDEKKSQVATSGDYSKVATSGDSSQVATSGDSSKVATSGDYSKVATSGDSSQVATSGDSSKVATSGGSSKVATSGDSSKVATSGGYSQVILEGKDSIGMCCGQDSIIKGKKGDWITLAEWEWNDKKERYVPKCVKSAKIDGKIIKEDTFYCLEDGEFKEW